MRWEYRIFNGLTKGTVFFFPGNSLPPLTHSIFDFFFPQKKYMFFFSQEKFEGHSLTWGADIYKKRSKTRIFCNFFTFGLFFFQLFFFPRKSLHPTHSLNFGRPEKKTAVKKQNTFFTHSVDFYPKVSKVKLFRGKK